MISENPLKNYYFLSFVLVLLTYVFWEFSIKKGLGVFEKEDRQSQHPTLSKYMENHTYKHRWEREGMEKVSQNSGSRICVNENGGKLKFRLSSLFRLTHIKCSPLDIPTQEKHFDIQLCDILSNHNVTQNKRLVKFSH